MPSASVNTGALSAALRVRHLGADYLVRSRTCGPSVVAPVSLVR
jgi:hypothetical protein